MGKIYKNGIEYGGSGGGSAGHIILDNDGTAMAEEPNLQFKGLDVTDNSTDGVTEVESIGLNQDSLDDVTDGSIGNEIINNGMTYSTNEQIVGKWIDGKPLYQKTINCGALPNNTVKTVAHSISNLDYIIGWSGTASQSTGIYIEFPYVNIITLGNSCNVWIDKTDISIETASDLRHYTKSYITIQYTKTTD